MFEKVPREQKRTTFSFHKYLETDLSGRPFPEIALAPVTLWPRGFKLRQFKEI